MSGYKIHLFFLSEPMNSWRGEAIEGYFLDIVRFSLSFFELPRYQEAPGTVTCWVLQTGSVISE